jgi:hypothetical protein
VKVAVLAARVVEAVGVVEVVQIQKKGGGEKRGVLYLMTM